MQAVKPNPKLHSAKKSPKMAISRVSRLLRPTGRIRKKIEPGSLPLASYLSHFRLTQSDLDQIEISQFRPEKSDFRKLTCRIKKFAKKKVFNTLHWKKLFLNAGFASTSKISKIFKIEIDPNRKPSFGISDSDLSRQKDCLRKARLGSTRLEAFQQRKRRFLDFKIHHRLKGFDNIKSSNKQEQGASSLAARGKPNSANRLLLEKRDSSPHSVKSANLFNPETILKSGDSEKEKIKSLRTDQNEKSQTDKEIAPKSKMMKFVTRMNRKEFKSVSNSEVFRKKLEKQIEISKIPNRFNVDDKTRFFENNKKSANFEFIPKYEAIQMQEREKKRRKTVQSTATSDLLVNPKMMSDSNPKSAIINSSKQKQSPDNSRRRTHTTKLKCSHGQITLKRTFGVSYIKPRRMHQKGVSEVYQPLPNLVIQASKNCEVLEDLVAGFDSAIQENFFDTSNLQKIDFFNSQKVRGKRRSHRIRKKLSVRKKLGFAMNAPKETDFRWFLESFWNSNQKNHVASNSNNKNGQIEKIKKLKNKNSSQNPENCDFVKSKPNFIADQIKVSELAKSYFAFDSVTQVQDFFQDEVFLAFFLDCSFTGRQRRASKRSLKGWIQPVEMDSSENFEENESLQNGLQAQKILDTQSFITNLKSHKTSKVNKNKKNKKDSNLSSLKSVLGDLISSKTLIITVYSKNSLNSKKCFLKGVPVVLPEKFQQKYFAKKKRGKPKSKNPQSKNNNQTSPPNQLENENPPNPKKDQNRISQIDYTPSQIVELDLQNPESLEATTPAQIEAYLDYVTEMTPGNLQTLSLKLEAFVDPEFWKQLSCFERNVVFTYVNVFKLKLQEFLFYRGQEWFEFKKSQAARNETMKKLVSKKNKQNSKKKKGNLKKRKYSDSDENFVPSSRKYSQKSKQTKKGSQNKLQKTTPNQNNQIVENNTNKIKKNFIQDFETRLASLHLLSSDLAETLTKKFQKKLRRTKPDLPFYFVDTRDCFLFDLKETTTPITTQNRQFTLRKYFFQPHDLPSNFGPFLSRWPNLDSGVYVYENFFTESELRRIEDAVDLLEEKFYNGAFLRNTGQTSIGGSSIKRTKFFFGARYTWHDEELRDPHSDVAAGVRVDTSEPPIWMKQLVSAPMEQAGIVSPGFFNSMALNIYHDGDTGLAQHFDDAVRFKQPIYSLRVFSDARLSFGSQLYSFCNGAFSIDLPRGAVCVMAEHGYAANGLKHCIRPVDMTGRSAAFILRQMHPEAVKVARDYDWLVEFPLAFQTLSLAPNAVPYVMQKAVLLKKRAEAKKVYKDSEETNSSSQAAKDKLTKGRFKKTQQNSPRTPEPANKITPNHLKRVKSDHATAKKLLTTEKPSKPKKSESKNTKTKPQHHQFKTQKSGKTNLTKKLLGPTEIQKFSEIQDLLAEPENSISKKDQLSLSSRKSLVLKQKNWDVKTQFEQNQEWVLKKVKKIQEIRRLQEELEEMRRKENELSQQRNMIKKKFIRIQKIED